MLRINAAFEAGSDFGLQISFGAVKPSEIEVTVPLIVCPVTRTNLVEQDLHFKTSSVTVPSFSRRERSSGQKEELSSQ